MAELQSGVIEEPAASRGGRPTRSDRLRDAIADEILTGQLAPGTRLDEKMLADRFGVSRTPVREALRQLGATGLVETRPHRGAVVTALAPDRLVELFEAMGELEAVCTRLAALRMSAVERRGLESLHLRLRGVVQDGDPETYHRANLEFHTAIYQGSHNLVVMELAQSLRARLVPYRRAQFRTPGRLARSFAEHDSIVRAIVRGDAEGASQAMRRHVALVGDAFADFADRIAEATREATF